MVILKYMKITLYVSFIYFKIWTVNLKDPFLKLS